mmetsp:Transcript_15531/g.29658  ORF Transcript_15531/g.29658 Transcript_15531/m.29658 type:complete len:96 (-) Transcript_15531:415-702(-)|eukprot:scaffold6899_cov183-Amphora_coffeaeformis.AAC.19
MKWEKTELQVVIKSISDYQLLEDQRKTKIDSRFGEEFDHLSDELRETTGPLEMLRLLIGDQPVVPSDTISPMNASAITADDKPFLWACGDRCMTM